MEDKYRGLIARYYDRELSEEAAHAVELHVAGCAACREELLALRSLTRLLQAATEPVFSTEGAAAEAFWETVQPSLGHQRAPVPWRSWLPGLLLLALQALLAIGLTLGGLAGVSVRLPGVLPPLVPLPGVPLPLMALPGPAVRALFSIGVVGAVGVLYLIWLAAWWRGSQAAVESVNG